MDQIEACAADCCFAETCFRVTRDLEAGMPAIGLLGASSPFNTLPTTKAIVCKFVYTAFSLPLN